MKRVSFIALLLMVIFFKQSISQVVDTKANAILDKVSAKMKSYTSMKIEFTYTLDNKAEKIHQSKTGVVTIKGDKYTLNVQKQRIISDGKTVWTYIPDANEVQINNVNTKDDEALNPAKLLSTYNKNYRAKLIKEAMMDGVSTQIIDLVPIKGKAFFKVRLLIDKIKLQVISTEIYNKNGSIYAYKVNKFTPNTKVADSDFVFKAAEFPGVELNDMR
ncbi:MAG: outer membrane lipoprotein carrier protein LolA [Bacteroidetes bacterium]|nr:outer membrane lipoprotein carrier protein LolA [Bacteroidota bacterium]